MNDFPSAYQQHIRALQQCVVKTSGMLRQGSRGRRALLLRRGAWSSYLMSRSALLARPDKVPLSLWSGLWNTFAQIDTSEYIDRMAQLKYLGDDIRKIGISMDSDQTLLYIEALLAQGDAVIASKLWESLEAQFKSSGNLRDYYRLGINIFSQQGRVDRALQIANVAFQETKDVDDYRILLPIIQACLLSRDRYGVQMAWALYIRLRVHLGSHLTMSDYDLITLSFLQADRLDLALGVFTDMMLQPDVPKGKDSAELYGALAGNKDRLQSLDIGEAELDLQSSSTLTSLPPKFRNKFFLGSWLKKLIGEGQLDAAKKIIDFAPRMGIIPDARHINGLIGALFREGTGKSAHLAEQMASKMIASRLGFVRTRELDSKLERPIRALATSDKPDAKSLALSLNDTPKATIETFCILIQQYRRQQKQQKLLHLFDTIREAKISPNTYFMNELLNMDARTHRIGWAFNTYFSLTKAKGLRPNYETFRILYSLECQSLDRVLRSGNQASYTMPRQLFSEMMKYRPFLQKEGNIPRDLYDAIIFGFSLAQDQAGTAVALRALERYFDVYPNEGTARTVILQLARLGHRDEAGHRLRRLNIRTSASKQRIAQVTQILENLKQERANATSQQGKNLEQLTDDEKAEESLSVLLSLLHHAFQSRMGTEDEDVLATMELSRKAAEEMGVPQCIP